MKAELEQKLQEDFPFMRRHISEDGQNPYTSWGCECSDGWYQLIHDLCQEITDRYAKAGLPVDIVVHQIKEKYAGLRFYYGFEKEPSSLQAIDIIGEGGVRIYPKKENEDEIKKQLHTDIEDIVLAYEEKSETVCEDCGKEGSVRNDLSWILTLCDDCYGKYLKKTAEKK